MTAPPVTIGDVLVDITAKPFLVTRVDEERVWLRWSSPLCAQRGGEVGYARDADGLWEEMRVTGEKSTPDDPRFQWPPPPKATRNATTPQPDNSPLDVPTVKPSWLPVHLGPILDGTLVRHTPTVGVCDDGTTALFYPAKVNGIAGASGSGKSWSALLVAAQEIRLGVVVYLDFEDDATAIVGRLLDLGADRDDIVERFVYIHPDDGLDRVTHEAVLAMIAERQARLVVLDSTGEAMSLDGIKPNDDDLVARWFQYMPGRTAKLGPAVIVLDHMTKADDGGLWPIGSQRKRAAISGAQYIQKTATPFAKGEDGRAWLVCAKDRQGTYKSGVRVADLVVEHGVLGVRMTLRAATDRGADDRHDDDPLVGHKEDISRLLEASDEPLSTRAIIKGDAIKGNSDRLAEALKDLVLEGFVTVTGGPRGSHLHASARPYRQHPGDRPPTVPRPSPGTVGASVPRPPSLRDGDTRRSPGDATDPTTPGDTHGATLPGFEPPRGEGRCPACGFHESTQGHRPGCTTGGAG